MSIRNYILRRLISIPGLLLAISVLVFVVINAAPGDPVRIMLGGSTTANEDVIRLLKEKYGLDQPLYIQYLKWLWNLLQGDLGYSFTSSAAVVNLIGARFWRTLQLTLSAQVLALLLAIPLGAAAAVRHQRWLDNLLTPLSLFGYSMPVFWLGLMAIWLFSLQLGWFPTSGAGNVGGEPTSLLASLRYMVLPVVVLGLNQATFLFRLMRSSMLEVLRQDYLRTARAKGLPERIVVFKHALRNALLPLVTAIGLNFGYLLSGSVYIETVFAWPGMGRFTVAMALQRDYPALMGVYMLSALVMVVSIFLTDISYAFIDPRVRYD